MKLSVTEQSTGGDLHLLINEKHFDRMFFTRDREHKHLTIAWNRGPVQTVIIDEVAYDFLPNTILPLMVNQSFRFEKPQDIVAWQFNRDFYCIVDHDEEVSCVGFLFYGSAEQVFVQLDETMQFKLQRLLEIFIEEFETADSIQVDMLRMLLKRLIILVTRLAKAIRLSEPAQSDEKFATIRKFNLLVENNFRQQHTVAYYAQQLNKSPKTLSNVFALYNHKTPLQIIQERLILEAKRLLYYTDKSAKEITYELGFDDAAYFSNFFKKHTSFSPTDFRNNKVLVAEGK
ncbi:helix-turn-helix domain-containing protein [Mucilaginibacter celer]|uniref:Helix-turn-helix domain-containing protein n=1 Tax=Mucilaginibacter celer TaxID=2305508 RepID=A0A494VUM0_9SPHI|nr:AraC family transcriptional regulator [Mucilaginibacter celer]AYL94682.1 helix-turn-helix domain-containing protein [Mucilaginibacter celer]